MDWMGDERVSGQRTYTSHCGAPHSYFHLSLLFHLVFFLLSLILASATVLANICSTSIDFYTSRLRSHPLFGFPKPLRYQSFFSPSLPCLRPFHSAIPFSSSSSCTCHSIIAPQSTTPTMSFDSRHSYLPMPMPMPSHFLPYRSYTHSLFDASSQTWWTFEFCSVFSPQC